MAVRVAARVPPELLRRGRVLRPIDAGGIYTNPRAEFARLTRAGALHRLAPGLFVAVPDDRVGRAWLPPLEAAALGIAQSGGHIDDSALMGISAARVHGAIPRALNVAVVAIGRHRRALQLTDRPATIHFIRRDVTRLDVQRHRTDLGQGWITTVEQTVLDLITRPDLGGVPDAAEDAIAVLIPRTDVKQLRELAANQRHRRAVDDALRAHRPA
ncbi:MAG: type IV toxin-antitoxin system AbiEi family antitoxin [Pseudonocardia sp.]